MNIDHLFVRDCCSSLADTCGLDYKYDDLPPHIAVTEKEYLAQWELPKGTETLGAYFLRYTMNRIRLYRCPIEAAARHIGCEAGRVTKVVLIHELAHSVTHLGYGLCCGKQWDSLLKKTPEEGKEYETTDEVDLPQANDKCNPVAIAERMAQGITLLYLKQGKLNNDLKVFKEMSKHSPQIYRDWIDFDEVPMEDAIINFREELHSHSQRGINKSADNFSS